jgi:hypothetical protein
MAVALLVWVAWIINLKYEVRSRKYENTSGAYLAIMSLPIVSGGIFFMDLLVPVTSAPFTNTITGPR